MRNMLARGEGHNLCCRAALFSVEEKKLLAYVWAGEQAPLARSSG